MGGERRYCYRYWDFSKAITYHAQHLAIAKEVGDRAGEGGAYGNLGISYRSQGDFSKAVHVSRCVSPGTTYGSVNFILCHGVREISRK